MGEVEAKIVPPLSPARHSSVDGQANASNENWTMPTSRISAESVSTRFQLPGAPGEALAYEDARAAAEQSWAEAHAT